MKKIVSKDLDFDSQLEDILSLDRGIPSDIGETVKNIIEDVGIFGIDIDGGGVILVHINGVIVNVTAPRRL